MRGAVSELNARLRAVEVPLGRLARSFRTVLSASDRPSETPAGLAMRSGESAGRQWTVGSEGSP